MNIIINIDVPDLERGIDFYTRALGLAHARTLDDDVAELRGASATIYLLCKPAGSVAIKAPPVARDFTRHWTPVHFDLVVDDVDAAAARAIASGANPETGHIDWRGSRCVSFSDPFGNGFCFIQFAENGTYRN
ncbi:MAG: VOC family protein [Steroidobacteraceae bacterium]|nr:VOC family protein [Steroidobacteraceae bacterium]